MISKTLANAQVGDVCLVTEIAQKPVELRSRLYALGVIPGASIQILRVAPLGDPMQIKVGATLLSMRKTDARIINVQIQ
ncbi:MAG: FeoA family protein [Pseudohongiellaceae bacterium]